MMYQLQRLLAMRHLHQWWQMLMVLWASMLQQLSLVQWLRHPFLTHSPKRRATRSALTLVLASAPVKAMPQMEVSSFWEQTRFISTIKHNLLVPVSWWFKQLHCKKSMEVHALEYPIQPQEIYWWVDEDFMQFKISLCLISEQRSDVIYRWTIFHDIFICLMWATLLHPASIRH